MKKILVLLWAVVMFSACSEQRPANISDQATAEHLLKHPEWSKHSNIYEVNVRQYTPEGTFNAFEKHLDRLSKMGVDILWFMPITPIGEKNRKGTLGSYYSVKDYTAVNPEFGTLEDFKSLVKSAHAKGMHVIIDWVANHTAWDNAWITEHPEWYKKDSLGNIVSPFDWSDVAALDYSNHQLWKAMIGSMEFWLKNSDIDGFRCDVAGMVPVPFWDSARMALDNIRPVFMLAEAEEPDLNRHAFDMSYGWEMHHTMAQVAQGKQPATAIDKIVKKDLQQFGSNTYMMQFTTNHDENSWNGTEYEKMGDAAETMAVLSWIIPGMPLIYTGQEAANHRRLKFFDKDSIQWNNYPLESFYAGLINLKDKNPALWNGDFGGSYRMLSNSDAAKVLSFVRVKQKNKVLFIANMSGEPVTTKIDFGLDAGKYTDWSNGNQAVLGSSNEIKLTPWQYKIYVK